MVKDANYINSHTKGIITCHIHGDFDHNNGKSLSYLGFDFSHYTEGGFHNVYNGGIKKINRIPSKHKQLSELIKNGTINVVYNASTKVYIYTKKKRVNF